MCLGDAVVVFSSFASRACGCTTPTGRAEGFFPLEEEEEDTFFFSGGVFDACLSDVGFAAVAASPTDVPSRLFSGFLGSYQSGFQLGF